MAIDSRQKRFSMMNFGWIPPVCLFEADGSVDTDDRNHLLNLYSGITFGAGTTVVPVTQNLTITTYQADIGYFLPVGVNVGVASLTITTYSAQVQGGNVWTVQNSDSGVWSVQTKDSGVWTVQ